MRSAFAAVMICAAGCEQVRYVATEPWSKAPEIRVAAIVTKDSARAFALAGDASFELSIAELSRGETVAVWIFSYSASSLIALAPALEGLTSSEIAELIAPSFGEAGRVAPSAEEVLRAEIAPGSEAEVAYRPARWEEWTREGGTPPLTFEAEVFSPCVEFDVSTFDLSGSFGRGILAVSASETTALVSADDGPIFLATLEGVRELGLPREIPHHAGFQRDDGEIWLLGAGGGIARGKLDRGFTRSGTTSTGGGRNFMWMDGAPGGPFELYTVNDDRRFERFDGTTWTVIDDQSGVDASWHGGVAWIRENEAIGFAGPLARHIIRWRDGTKSEEELVPGELQAPSAAARIPGFGAVVGTEVGTLFVDRGDGTWERLPPTPQQGVPIFVIAPLDSGFVFGGAVGGLAQYYPDYGYCDVRPYASLPVWDVAAIGDGLVLMQSNRSNDETAVRILKRRKRTSATR
jgi:hypothetical protein